MRIRTRKPALATFAAAGLLLAACSNPGDPEAASQSAGQLGVDQQQSAASGAQIESVQIPATPAGTKAQWIIAVLQGGPSTTVEQWETELDPTFLEQVPAREVVELINTNLRPARPFVVTAYQGTETQATATLQGALGDPFNLSVTLGDIGKITGLWFGPAQDPDWKEPTSIGDVEQRLQQIPTGVSALVLSGDDVLIDLNSDKEVPLASIFKLYVLLAVGQAVQDGTLTWDEKLTITDELRSLPSGELQQEPAGTEITVQDAALKMISISDNTATDLLIDRLGRKAVETAVEDSGHHDPAALRPFLSTRELFTLGWGDPAYRKHWESGDESERRELLDQIDAAPLAVNAGDVTGEPVWTEGIDWFASATDIAAAHRALQELGSPEIDAILSQNPGVDLGDWPYGAFKGGSSIGVLTGSWLLEDEEGSAMVVFLLQGRDPQVVEGQAQELFGLAQATIKLLH